MDLLLIRHAIAAQATAEQADAERPLTERGRRRFRRSVRGLEALGLRFDRILYSPRLRAVQTAEELAPLLAGEAVVTPHLAQSPVEALYGELRGAECAAAVGHEPWLSEWLAWLLVGRGRASPRVEFKKGGAAWLRGESRDAGMALVAFLPPRALARLRR